FRLVIARGRMGPCPPRAHVEETSHTRRFGRADHVLRCARVGALESLLADFADDADEMNYRVRALERTWQGCGVQHVAFAQLGSVTPHHLLRGRRLPIAHQQTQFVACAVEFADYLPSDEASSACYEND